MSEKRVYTFGNGKAEGKADMRNLLGGKGANLAEMNLIGVPVPPGFTITTDVCNEYFEKGKEAAKPEVRDDSATHDDQAVIILEGLGGKDNIIDVTNCVTRLRVNVKDESLVKDDNFLKKSGALGVARNGKAIQVIIGFSVGQVRESFEKLLK